MEEELLMKDHEIKTYKNKFELAEARVKENMGKAKKREDKLKEVIENYQKKLDHKEVKSGEAGKWDNLIKLQQEARSKNSAFNDLQIKYENLRKRKYDKDAAFRRECEDEKKIKSLQKQLTTLREEKFDMGVKHELELEKKDEKIAELKLIRKPMKLLGQILFIQNDDLIGKSEAIKIVLLIINQNTGRLSHSRPKKLV